ncbi:MAG: succinate dehydrogenase assembly factor 2 [Rhizobiaceae bacterium]
MNDTNNETRLKRLIYRANHRGIKEMDIILGGFANTRLRQLTDVELDEFEALMEENDRDLLVWFTGEAKFPIMELHAIFDTVSRHLSTSGSDA